MSAAGATVSTLTAAIVSFVLPFADPKCPSRYHCTHEAGVHSVGLTWIHKLHKFLGSGEFSVLCSVFPGFCSKVVWSRGAWAAQCAERPALGSGSGVLRWTSGLVGDRFCLPRFPVRAAALAPVFSGVIEQAGKERSRGNKAFKVRNAEPQFSLLTPWSSVQLM